MTLRRGRSATSGDETGGFPVIDVSMDDGRIVLRPHGHLDQDMVDTMQGLLAGAAAAGTVAIVDLTHAADADLPTADILATAG